jgi:hypothetical protein
VPPWLVAAWVVMFSGCQPGPELVQPPGPKPPVSQPPTSVSAPEVVRSSPLAITVPASGTVTLWVEARDARGGALGFAWEASAGTLGTPTSTASTSEVLWTAPACLSGGGEVSLTVTVRNAQGRSTPVAFTVQGLPECSPLQ